MALPNKWFNEIRWGKYGIHGTNRPHTIGSEASPGCIRMLNPILIGLIIGSSFIILLRF
ncbi:L,D-transpeptidase family protein [Clostridium sp. DJ247]|nr:L,D-transpeptidase family protein [Clostridium sp. DJ247]